MTMTIAPTLVDEISMVVAAAVVVVVAVGVMMLTIVMMTISITIPTSVTLIDGIIPISPPSRLHHWCHAPVVIHLSILEQFTFVSLSESHRIQVFIHLQDLHDSGGELSRIVLELS